MITNQLTKTNKLIMKDDIMFKAFFSKKGSDKYLKDFLSAILGKETKIKKVIHDSHLEQLARESKYGILDLDVELARRNKKASLSDQCKEIEENNRMGKTRDQKIRYRSGSRLRRKIPVKAARTRRHAHGVREER